MKREHSIFICLDGHKIVNILHPYFRRKGWLKDVPKGQEPVPLDDVPDINIEYNWEEEIA